MRILALDSLQPGTSAEHAVELLYHFVNRLVEIACSGAAYMVISAHFEMPLAINSFW